MAAGEEVRICHYELTQKRSSLKVRQHVGTARVDYPITVIDGAVSERWIQSVLEEAEKRTYRDLAEEYSRRYRTGTRSMWDDSDRAEELWNCIRPYLPEKHLEKGCTTVDLRSSKQLGKWDPYGLNPRLRVCQTFTGGHFSRHQDLMYDLDYPRICGWKTVLLYLQEPKEGGETAFHDLNHEGYPVYLSVRPKRGRILLFDANLLHSGQVVTRGTKITLRTDLEYVKSE